MKVAQYKQDPAKVREQDAIREIAEIQRGFAALRAAGGWKSPWPQQAFSKVLGVTVREVRVT